MNLKVLIYILKYIFLGEWINNNNKMRIPVQF